MCHIDDIPKITGVLEEFIPGKNGCEVFKKWVNISSDGLRRQHCGPRDGIINCFSLFQTITLSMEAATNVHDHRIFN